MLHSPRTPLFDPSREPSFSRTMTKLFSQTKAFPLTKGSYEQALADSTSPASVILHFSLSLRLYIMISFLELFSVFLFGGSRTSLSFGGPLVILIVAKRPKCHPQTALKDYRPMAFDRRPHLPVRPGPAAADDSSRSPTPSLGSKGAAKIFCTLPIRQHVLSRHLSSKICRLGLSSLL